MHTKHTKGNKIENTCNSNYLVQYKSDLSPHIHKSICQPTNSLAL